MNEQRVKKLEQELSKYQPAEGADQARVDILLHDLNKIYGDGQGADPMTADEFNKTIESLMAQYGMKKIKPA